MMPSLSVTMRKETKAKRSNASYLSLLAEKGVRILETGGCPFAKAGPYLKPLHKANTRVVVQTANPVPCSREPSPILAIWPAPIETKQYPGARETIEGSFFNQCLRGIMKSVDQPAV